MNPRIAIVALLALVLFPLCIIASGEYADRWGLGAPGLRVGVGDLYLYRDVVGRVHGGQGYYPALLDAFNIEWADPAHPVNRGGYVPRSLFNWRWPTLTWMLSHGPPDFWAALLISLSIVAVIAAAWAASGGLPTMLLLAGGAVYWSMADRLAFYSTEPWCESLLLISLVAYRRDNWIGGMVASLLALSLRELVLPWCLVALFLSVVYRRRAESAAWLAALLIYFGLFAMHARAVAAVCPVSSATDMPWLTLPGFGFVLQSIRINIVLSWLPAWTMALYLPLAVLGLATWRSPIALRMLLIVAAYTVAFLLVRGWHYWGLVAWSPLVFGIVRAPGAIIGLVRVSIGDFNKHIFTIPNTGALNMKRLSKNVAFTFIELLVVIGIVAILVGIVLPVLARARESANTSACLSNLRQLGQAIRVYADDNGGEILPAFTAMNTNPPCSTCQLYNPPTSVAPYAYWTNALAPYFNKTAQLSAPVSTSRLSPAFRCPSQGDPLSALGYSANFVIMRDLFNSPGQQDFEHNGASFCVLGWTHACRSATVGAESILIFDGSLTKYTTGGTFATRCAPTGYSEAGGFFNMAIDYDVVEPDPIVNNLPPPGQTYTDPNMAFFESVLYYNPADPLATVGNWTATAGASYAVHDFGNFVDIAFGGALGSYTPHTLGYVAALMNPTSPDVAFANNAPVWEGDNDDSINSYGDIRWRHVDSRPGSKQGKANFLWADGHCSSQAQRSVVVRNFQPKK